MAERGTVEQKLYEQETEWLQDFCTRTGYQLAPDLVAALLQRLTIKGVAFDKFTDEWKAKYEAESAESKAYWEAQMAKAETMVERAQAAQAEWYSRFCPFCWVWMRVRRLFRRRG